MGTLETLSIERRIWIIRGMRVMLDSDLAVLYGVTTKRLNQQVARNPRRFPTEYCFSLKPGEYAALRLQNATLEAGRGKYRKYLPHAFTEHGAVMLASVLNTPQAVTASLRIVDAFVRLRDLIAERDGLGRKLDEIQKQVAGNTTDISRIFNVLDDLLPAPGAPKKKIGFRLGGHFRRAAEI